MNAQKELEILGYLKENPTAPAGDRREWISPTPMPDQQQFDTGLPIGAQAGQPQRIRNEIAAYLRDQLQLTDGGDNPTVVAPGTFAARPIIFEDDAALIGIDYISYQFYFQDQDAARVRQHVAQRWQQLTAPSQPSPTPAQQILNAGPQGHHPPPPDPNKGPIP